MGRPKKEEWQKKGYKPPTAEEDARDFYKELADVVAETEGKQPGENYWSKTRSEVKDGDNTRFLKNALAAWDLPKVDTSDDAAVDRRIKLYFEYCAVHDIKPQPIGMAQWLGVSRDTLQKWKSGLRGNHVDTIDKAYLVMESLWADYMQSGKINPVSGIFLAKTWFGYREQTEYVLTPGKTEEVSMSELIAEAKLISGNKQKVIDAKPVDE